MHDVYALNNTIPKSCKKSCGHFFEICLWNLLHFEFLRVLPSSEREIIIARALWSDLQEKQNRGFRVIWPNGVQFSGRLAGSVSFGPAERTERSGVRGAGTNETEQDNRPENWTEWRTNHPEHEFPSRPARTRRLDHTVTGPFGPCLVTIPLLLQCF